MLKKPKRKSNNKTYRILLPTGLIKSVKKQFKEDELKSERLLLFQSQYNLVKEKHPKFNLEIDSKS